MDTVSNSIIDVDAIIEKYCEEKGYDKKVIKAMYSYPFITLLRKIYNFDKEAMRFPYAGIFGIKKGMMKRAWTAMKIIDARSKKIIWPS